MGLFQTDAVLKTSIELGLQDMRENPWLIDFILEDYVKNPYLKEKYGMKQIDACKEWFANNAINVVVGYHGSKMKTPCVSIILDPQTEKEEMKTMGDASTMSAILVPNKIGKPIPFIVKPFIPIEYDSDTGQILIDKSIDLSGVEIGQILVNPATGIGYPILDIIPNGIIIQSDQEIDSSQLGILPKYQYYKANIEHIYQELQCTILCTSHGDPQNVLWLHDMVFHCLLRYKESLLEALGLAETVISSGSLAQNMDITSEGAQYGWDRSITLTGQIEQTFVKAPRRIIESTQFKEKVPNKCDTYTGGIKIYSNLNSSNLTNDSDESWTTIEEDEE